MWLLTNLGVCMLISTMTFVNNKTLSEAHGLIAFTVPKKKQCVITWTQIKLCMRIPVFRLHGSCFLVVVKNKNDCVKRADEWPRCVEPCAHSQEWHGALRPLLNISCRSRVNGMSQTNSSTSEEPCALVVCAQLYFHSHGKHCLTYILSARVLYSYHCTTTLAVFGPN